MKRLLRTLGFAGFVCLSFFAAYRIVVHTVADQYVLTEPERALRWLPGHPGALLVLAERQMAAGEASAAASTARRLLAAAPLEGRALRILGQAAAAAGDTDQALVLHERAAIRSPRDVPTRTWLIRHYVTNGDYSEALKQVDRLLRFSPRHGVALRPLIAQLAQDPAFVSALIPVLAERPAWREGFLRELQGGHHPEAAEIVLGALNQNGGLTQDEHQRWIEDLMRQGFWGKAYSHWASALPAGSRLKSVHNGGFDQVPADRGFDWRLRRVPGVFLTFEPDERNTGLMAHVSFRRRPVPHAGLEQALLLAPGSYQLSVRMRADGLRSESGLEWQIHCHAGNQLLGRSERVNGNFAWRIVNAPVDIPPNCDGQWLRLRNPAPRGTAQFVAGELWIDDVTITPLPST